MGKWVFAHNGNIKNFDKHKENLLNLVDPDLSHFILGSTDSEIIFYIILTELKKLIGLQINNCDIKILQKACALAITSIIKVIGECCNDDKACASETFLTFIITNGVSMLAFQGGKDIYYSTYKNKCQDRDFCKSFAPNCEAPTQDGRVNHLIFSSEPLSGENIWIPIKFGQMLGIDWKMNLTFF